MKHSLVVRVACGRRGLERHVRSVLRLEDGENTLENSRRVNAERGTRGERRRGGLSAVMARRVSRGVGRRVYWTRLVLADGNQLWHRRSDQKMWGRGVWGRRRDRQGCCQCWCGTFKGAHTPATAWACELEGLWGRRCGGPTSSRLARKIEAAHSPRRRLDEIDGMAAKRRDIGRPVVAFAARPGRPVPPGLRSETRGRFLALGKREL